MSVQVLELDATQLAEIKNWCFHTAIKHLQKQKVKSFVLSGYRIALCKYSNDGLKCAVGALLNDKEMHHREEGISIYSLAKKYVELGINPHFWGNKEIISLLTDIQDLHDSVDVIPGTNEINFSTLLPKAVKVAKKHGVHIEDIN